MASNHKLTALIQGRRIVSTANQGDSLVIGFDDDSTMTVQTAGSSHSAATGSVIAAARQQDTELHLDFEGGGSMTVQMAGPTASVMVRGRDHRLEYAD